MQAIVYITVLVAIPARTFLYTERVSRPPFAAPFSPRTLAQPSGMGANVNTFITETHHRLTEGALNCGNKNQHNFSQN